MAQKQILMVDSSKATSKILSRLIEKRINNCYVTCCHNAKDALDKMAEKKFDLVTSSLVLPDENGLHLAQKVMALKNHQFVPFLIVSGDIDEDVMKQGFKVGVTGYFNKASGHSALIDYIESLLPKDELFKANVLYVEDSKTAALRASRILNAHGFKLTHTDNAEHAYELISKKTAPEPPEFDIIVVDLTLNGEMNGYDLVQHIRGRLHYSKSTLPILIASGDETKIENVLACGANDFIMKPIHEALFCIRLHGLLAVRDYEINHCFSGSY